MAVHGIRDSTQLRAARAAYAVAGVSPSAQRREVAPASPVERSTSVRISEGGELLSKLRRLHDSKPKEFKQLVGDLASAAEARVAEATGEAGRVLRTIADRFSEAAREGNITPLVPDLEAARTGRGPYARREDVLLAPSEEVQQLFRGFVSKVNSALPIASESGPTVRRDAP